METVAPTKEGTGTNSISTFNYIKFLLLEILLPLVDFGTDLMFSFTLLTSDCLNAVLVKLESKTLVFATGSIAAISGFVGFIFLIWGAVAMYKDKRSLREYAAWVQNQTNDSKEVCNGYNNRKVLRGLFEDIPQLVLTAWVMNVTANLDSIPMANFFFSLLSISILVSSYFVSLCRHKICNCCAEKKALWKYLAVIIGAASGLVVGLLLISVVFPTGNENPLSGVIVRPALIDGSIVFSMNHTLISKQDNNNMTIQLTDISLPLFEAGNRRFAKTSFINLIKNNAKSDQFTQFYDSYDICPTENVNCVNDKGLIVMFPPMSIEKDDISNFVYLIVLSDNTFCHPITCDTLTVESDNTYNLVQNDPNTFANDVCIELYSNFLVGVNEKGDITTEWSGTPSCTLDSAEPHEGNPFYSAIVSSSIKINNVYDC